MKQLLAKVDAVVMLPEEVHAEQAIEGGVLILNIDYIHSGVLPGMGADLEGSEADLIGGDQLAARQARPAFGQLLDLQWCHGAAMEDGLRSAGVEQQPGVDPAVAVADFHRHQHLVAMHLHRGGFGATQGLLGGARFLLQFPTLGRGEVGVVDEYRGAMFIEVAQHLPVARVGDDQNNCQKQRQGYAARC